MDFEITPPPTQRPTQHTTTPAPPKRRRLGALGQEAYIYTVDQLSEMMRENAMCMDSNKPEYRVRTREELTKLAASVDCELIIRQPDELLLDLDTPAALLEFYLRYRDNTASEVMRAYRGLPVLWVSRSGYGAHARVGVKEKLEDRTAVGYEIALGSDWRRGVLSLAEIDAGNDVNSVLFRPRKAKHIPYQETPRYVERLARGAGGAGGAGGCGLRLADVAIGSKELPFFPTVDVSQD